MITGRILFLYCIILCMNDLINQLIKEDSEKNIVKILSQIGEALLSSLLITGKGITIEPLWVEAYYHSEKFPDPFTHLAVAQRTEYLYLYLHQLAAEERDINPKTGKRKKCRAGVDICLHTGTQKYYLSFLIRRCRIGNKIYKQSDLQQFLSSFSYKDKHCKIKPKSNKPDFFAEPRINLSKTETESFAKLELSFHDKNLIDK